MSTHDTPNLDPSPLDALVRALEESPSPRDSTRRDWTALEQVYIKWHRATPERSRRCYWFEAKAYRLGKLPVDKASLIVMTLHLFEQHRIRDDRLRRKASGFDQRREIRRKAKDPVAYKAAAAERQRAYRVREREARQRQADLDAALEALEALDAGRASEPASEAESEPEWRRDDPLEDVDAGNSYAEAAE